MEDKETMSPEEANKRYRENVSKYGGQHGKDMTGDIAPKNPLKPGESMGGTETPTKEVMEKRQAKKAIEQAREQGSQIRTTERLQQVTKPGEERPTHKIKRLQREEIR